MRRRLPGLIYLGLSLLFLLVPAFRWALEISLRDRRPVDIDTFSAVYADMREQVLPASELTAMAERATKERDAQTLAFVAVTSASPSQALAAADQAYAIDPKFAWIGYYLLPIKQDPGANARWLAHLKESAPDNGVVYFAEARCIEAAHPEFPKNLHVPKGWTHPDPTPLVPQTEWLAAMEKAYAAPHYHGYEQERFLLDRDVMERLGRATPWKLTVVAGDQPLPNLLGVRNYASYKIYYLGANATRAHRYDQAAQQVQQTSLLGLRMATEGGTLIEQLIGQSIDLTAAQGEADLLRAQGRTGEADTAANRKIGYNQANRLFRHSNQVLDDTRLADIVYTHLLSYLYVACGILAVLALVVALLRRAHDGRFDRFVGATATAASRLMLLTAIALLAVYWPYAGRFRDYMRDDHPNPEYFIPDVNPALVYEAMPMR